MTRPVVWAPRAHAELLALHWRSGTRVDREVLHYAATGEGHLERVLDSPGRFRLLVVPYVAIVSAHEGTLYVWRVLRAR